MNERHIISISVAPIYNEASFKSEMVTQGLMYESVKVLDKKENWFKIKMNDDYMGWIHNSYLLKVLENYKCNYVITDRFVPIRSNSGKSSKIITLLSFGTKVPLIEKTSKYYKIKQINNDDGFIPISNNIFVKNRDSIISLAYSLIGVPYLWGGRSSFGFDCSGFVQSVFNALGISIPRDTNKQILMKDLVEVSKNEAMPGDLIFFSEKNHVNHVGFLIDGSKIIHCSGEVKLESIIEGSADYNSGLAKLDFTILSVSKLIEA